MVVINSRFTLLAASVSLAFLLSPSFVDAAAISTRKGASGLSSASAKSPPVLPLPASKVASKAETSTSKKISTKKNEKSKGGKKTKGKQHKVRDYFSLSHICLGLNPFLEIRRTGSSQPHIRLLEDSWC